MKEGDLTGHMQLNFWRRQPSKSFGDYCGDEVDEVEEVMTF